MCIFLLINNDTDNNIIMVFSDILSSRNNRANHNITVIKIGDCNITPNVRRQV